MHNYSCSGYLVKAADLTKLLPARVQEKYKTAVESGDWENATIIAEANWPEQLPPISTIFSMSDEAEFEDEEIQKGEMYAQFDDTDLYEKVPTLRHTNLMVEGIKPIHRSWVDCG
jgi:hypothetical protein